MSKLIRNTYPVELNIFILAMLFLLSFFFSRELFEAHLHDPSRQTSVYVGMFLMAVAGLLMVLIVWEEILFQVRVKMVEGGLLFRNRQAKLVVQVLLYLAIPAIFYYIYKSYDVKMKHFLIWAAVCMVPPVVEKIVSGINNFNDFLRLTNKNIAYKNNEKVGDFSIDDIQNMAMVKDEHNMINKLDLFFKNNNKVTIDLDEMELEDFYQSIQNYIKRHYKDLLLNDVNATVA